MGAVQGAGAERYTDGKPRSPCAHVPLPPSSPACCVERRPDDGIRRRLWPHRDSLPFCQGPPLRHHHPSTSLALCPPLPPAPSVHPTRQQQSPPLPAAARPTRRSGATTSLVAADVLDHINAVRQLRGNGDNKNSGGGGAMSASVAADALSRMHDRSYAAFGGRSGGWRWQKRSATGGRRRRRRRFFWLLLRYRGGPVPHDHYGDQGLADSAWPGVGGVGDASAQSVRTGWG